MKAALIARYGRFETPGPFELSKDRMFQMSVVNQSFAIREARIDDASHIARIHVDSWRETYSGLIPQAILDQLRYEQREAYWAGVLKNPSDLIVFVAEWTNGIHGFACGGVERANDPQHGSELYAIYVLEAVQKRGAGRALFNSVKRRLIELGYHSMLVWVLEGNPACEFYKVMGGRHIGYKDERFGDTVLREMGYTFKLVASGA